MIERTIQIQKPVGMRDNSLVRFVEIANRYQSRIQLTCRNYRMNAKSLLGIMNLYLQPGDTVILTAEGDDGNEAVQALEDLLTEYR